MIRSASLSTGTDASRIPLSLRRSPSFADKYHATWASGRHRLLVQIQNGKFFNTALQPALPAAAKQKTNDFVNTALPLIEIHRATALNIGLSGKNERPSRLRQPRTVTLCHPSLCQNHRPCLQVPSFSQLSQVFSDSPSALLPKYSILTLSFCPLFQDAYLISICFVCDRTTASGASYNIAVAQHGLAYTPNTTFANVGDTVIFAFYPSSHNVVQGPCSTPCQDSDGSGIYSGFIPSSSGAAVSSLSSPYSLFGIDRVPQLTTRRIAHSRLRSMTPIRSGSSLLNEGAAVTARRAWSA